MFEVRICNHSRALMVTATRLLTVMWVLLCIFLMLTHALASEKINYADCLGCHRGIESISPSHPFACAACHIWPKDRQSDALTSHQGIVRNPSAPEHVEVFCVQCHENEVRQVRNSLHSTMAGVINQTRYLWGAQGTAAPAVYGLSGHLKPLPDPHGSVYQETPAMLVDDFLRRRCLRCHIHSKGPEAPGLYRGTGCASCHMVYNNDGQYGGMDQAIDRSKKGYPVRHTFTRLIPNAQCLHCHNQNHVGADYEGLFQHDYSDGYRSPMVNGKLRPMVYGLDHHHLAKDIHAEKGLWCVDCHTRKDVMGDGRIYSYEIEVPKRSCMDCHGGFDQKTPDMTNKAIRKVSDGYLFISKNDGKNHGLRQFSADSIGHRVQAHAKVRCSACHAQWSFQDYGLSVIREDLINDYKWDHLTAQGDPYLQEKLKAYVESPETAYPFSIDRLSGEERPGIWSVGWRFRRWEQMPLGMDHTGRYAILRPLYQYFISYVDRAGNVVLDSVVPSRGDGTGKGWAFMPYVPHTTAPFGRACDACHQNRVTAGLGIQEEVTMDNGLTIPSPPAVKGMRLLNPREQQRLLKPTKEWHKERLKASKTHHE
ncbi:MAG: hypothetical protein ISR62_02650 [Desulfobacteraceae bacterium]|nr:hypothetical protein [Desulfobacterales bacterium]MBL6967302.1 hypothetical protein [Desulfobacteraceae bacterium]MBL7102250.1 hypothetical protein [Desulfobacteraceae bacterium]MBL7171284.1 hypothetical protein [Desulfobacteraceae bacterium]